MPEEILFTLKKLRKLVRQVIKERHSPVETRTAREIAEYITDITPEEENIPHHFINLILKSGKKFERRSLKVSDILKMDKDAENYVLSGEDRYGDDEYVDPDDLHLPIVIFNNEVLDGYSRLAWHYNNGEEYIDAYVA